MRLFKTTLPVQSLEDEVAALRRLAITNRTRSASYLGTSATSRLSELPEAPERTL